MDLLGKVSGFRRLPGQTSATIYDHLPHEGQTRWADGQWRPLLSGGSGGVQRDLRRHRPTLPV